MNHIETNPKINNAFTLFKEKERAFNEAYANLIMTAKQEFEREHGVKINESIIRLDNKKDLKGLIISLDLYAGKFYWECRIVKKDGTLSNVKRFYSCENEVDVVGSLKKAQP